MREVKIHHVYRHFRGKEYYVEGVAIHSETGQYFVVYRELYGDHRLFIRPLEMFMSEVDRLKYPYVTQRYRFEEVLRESRDK